jgi:TRAP-type C4-dicarboxylate transport system permease small subunit
VQAVPGRLGTLDRGLWRAVDAVLLLCVAGMLVAIVLQVGSRLGGRSLPWTEELSRFLFIWTAFLGMACGFRRVEHPRVTLLITRLPSLLRRQAVHLYAAAGVGFFALAGWHATLLVRQQHVFGETSPGLGIGMWLVTLPSAIAAFLAIEALLVSVYLDASTRAVVEGESEVAG